MTAINPEPRSFIDPRRLLRSIYMGRLAMTAAIYLAAVFAWRDADRGDTLVASLTITVAMIFTAGSALYSEDGKKSLGRTFLSLQAVFDLALVTAVVHITGGGASQFAALYILVIATSAVLLSTTGALLAAALACVLYFGDVILLTEAPIDAALLLQLGVFAVVALSSWYIAARLREARAGTEELAAELVKVRLEASDILRNIRSGIITIDARGTLLYANPTASTLLGLPLEGHIGESALALIEPVAPVLARAIERAAVDGVRTTRAEGTVATATRSFPIGLNTTVSVPNGTDGAPGAGTATVIFQDISDQKKLDTLHMRAERLEAVAELSASLAHEIKNPLASIRSAVEQLGRSPRANDDERSLSSLIVRESDRLSRLLSEFLDFARVRVTRIGPVDLASVARGATSLVATHPDRPEGVQVQCVVPEGEVIVEGDEDLLYRAVFNLALNAVQASTRPGTVRVEIAPLTSDDAPAGVSFDQGGVALRVSDEGEGIPSEIRDRLFDPFFTTKPGGSGLGLSVVHRAIESHRGFVFVDSDARGTRVTVLLPTFQADPESPRD
ncbi:MAG: PAS domain-containing protein [Gemmatimonadetes bacterium]|nr:PAS domain-containing protein [Gemmatimonadota bacterium]MBK6841167.1 PAS domain-containing protein [Gemmatimonadota bacterium]MBK9409191.1 PAS domain-containing protein [Gemmatimonadota bacterium]